MILDRLVLKNFKRFRDEEIHFRDGITGILGNNGTGKSSLVQAIFFALYGVQATGIAADYIVSSFASPKEKCEVRLDFRIGGDNYTVLRTFKKGKTVAHDATFHRNGKLMATGVSQVETEVKRTLGMGPVDFKNTIYAGQKDLLTLLENTPGKRKEWFLRALGIDYLNTGSQKVLKDQIDAKTGELQHREGELAAMAGRQSEEEFIRLQASVKTFTAAIADHEKQKAVLAQQRAELDAQLKRLAEKKLEYNRLLQQQQNTRHELAAETAQAKKLEAALALLADEEAEYQRIEKTAALYPEVRARLDALQKKKTEHAGLSAELKSAKQDTMELGEFITRIQEEIRGFDEKEQKKNELVIKVRTALNAGEIAQEQLETAVSFQLAEINKRSGTLSARLARYREEREKIASDRETIQNAGADGVCPLCRQKLGEHFGSIEAEFCAQLQELENNEALDLEKLEKLMAEKELTDGLKPLLTAIHTIEVELGQRPAAREQVRVFEGDLVKRKEAQQASEKAIADLAYDDAAFRAAEQEAGKTQKVQARFAELGRKIGQALTMKQQLADLTDRLAGRNAELKKLEKEIAAFVYDPQQTTMAETLRASTDTSLRNEEVAIANASRDKKFAEEKIAEYRRTAEQIALVQKQAGELKEEIENLKLTRTLIAEYVVYLMQVVRSRLEGEVSRIIGEITGGRYEQVLLDEDFNLLVRDVDEDYAIDRFSGGEQDDIAVALRIALSRYLAELHQVHESTFLIFDEIFGSQDEERRNNLLTALRTQESRFPQILLISHIAEMQGEFANTLAIEMGTDGSSRVREVE